MMLLHICRGKRIIWNIKETFECGVVLCIEKIEIRVILRENVNTSMVPFYKRVYFKLSQGTFYSILKENLNFANLILSDLVHSDWDNPKNPLIIMSPKLLQKIKRVNLLSLPPTQTQRWVLDGWLVSSKKSIDNNLIRGIPKKSKE